MAKFRTGDKVRYLTDANRANSKVLFPMTVGKIYSVVGVDLGVHVVSDSGQIGGFFERRFEKVVVRLNKKIHVL